MIAAQWQRATRVPGFERVFDFYLHHLLRKSFAAISIRNDAHVFPSGGYVGIGNHTSWWDGFIPFALHRSANRRRPFAIMMQDEQLRRFPFFRFGGAFSVDATSIRRAKPAIDYAAQLAASGCGVWIFPQGDIRPAFEPLRFSSGFAHAAARAGVPVVPCAMRFVQRNFQRPEVFVDIGEPFTVNARGAVREGESRVYELLARIDADLLADDVSSRYRPLVSGGRGVDDRAAALLRPFVRR